MTGHADADAIKYAYAHFPRSWVERSIHSGTLFARHEKRGSYSGQYGMIAVSGSGVSAKKCAFHELGHRFEHVVPTLKDAEAVFYNRRTKGSAVEKLNDVVGDNRYEDDEKTKKDSFVNPYIGKVYTDSYELISMGVELGYMKPAELAQDGDMQSWIYGLLLLR